MNSAAPLSNLATYLERRWNDITMVRITTVVDGRTTTIRVEGRLDVVAVRDLETECRAAGTPLRLNLSGLQSADAAGLEALRSLRAEGAKLEDASPYISQLLTQEAP